MNYHTRPASKKTSSGFTLIELLVVITIIAILAATLFPVFAQAKEAAKKATCLSNLKNISLAVLLYAEDYEGTIPPFSIYDYDYTDWYYKGISTWFTGVTFASLNDYYNRTGISVPAILDPYMKNEPIKECLSTKDFAYASSSFYLSQITNRTGYSPNSGMQGWSPDPVTLSDLDASAETIMLSDTAQVDWNFYTSSQAPVVLCGDQATIGMSVSGCMIHARHNKLASVAWYDGHVKAHSVVSPQGTSPSRASARYNHLGAVLKFPPVDPTYLDTPSDSYYYKGKKPAL